MPQGGPRDFLALQRTRLAAERTFLAYIRTGLALFAGAVGIPYLFRARASVVVGWFLGVLGVAVVAWGMFRFRSFRRKLSDRESRLRE
jgi:putative membrane protein